MSQKKKTRKYMKFFFFFFFFLLTKRKNGKKNGLIRDKVWIENVEMRVIKWESWNDNREEKNGREREMIFVPIVSRVVKKSKIIATIKPKRA